MKKFYILMLLCLTITLYGCAEIYTPARKSIPEDRGKCPINYEQTIRYHLQKSLIDPHSIQDLTINEPVPSVHYSGNGSPLYAWLVIATFNAKNRFGGYVGLQTKWYWFVNETLIGINNTFPGI